MLERIYNENNSEVLRKGFLNVLAVKNPDDDSKKYEVIETGNAVVVAVLTHDLRNIFVTKQWRPCGNNYEIGLVAGKIDKDKSPLEIALCEIEEEIRVPRKHIQNIRYMGWGYSSSGLTTEKVHRYIAILKEDYKQDETLDKAHDTDMIERFTLPFNKSVINVFSSNVSQLLMQEICLFYDVDLKLSNKKIGVMGGTFSPFTSQHLRNIIRAIEMYNLDEVIIVISSEKYNKKKLSYETRRRTVELGIKDLPLYMRNKVTISDIERKQIGGTTYETMLKLKESYGEFDTMYAIFGTDNIDSLGRGWDKGEELLKTFEIIAIERNGYEMKSIYQNSECQMLVPYADRIHDIPPITENAISSSIVRTRLMQRLDITTLVSNEVRDFLDSDTIRKELSTCYGYKIK